MPDKDELRRTLLHARGSVDPTLRASWDRAISARLLDWWTHHRVTTIGVYWPIRQEPDLHALYNQLAAAGVRLALPVVLAKNQALQFAAWTPGDALVKDALGVSIPAMQDFSVRPEALLIPCVGFNAAGMRLGYGGGFYDRTLATQPRPYTIGVAYSRTAVSFDGAAHDIALDAIVTESDTRTGDQSASRSGGGNQPTPDR